MKSRHHRLLRLQSVFDDLRKVSEREIVLATAERNALLRQRSETAGALGKHEALRNLVIATTVRRLAGISRRIIEIDDTIEKHRKKAADCFMKAKRAGKAAAELRQHQDIIIARRELTELTARASLRQGL